MPHIKAGIPSPDGGDTAYGFGRLEPRERASRRLRPRGHGAWEIFRTPAHPATQDRIKLKEHDSGQGREDDEFQNVQGDTKSSKMSDPFI